MVDCLCKMLRARATVLHASGVLTFVVATCFLPATLAQDAHSEVDPIGWTTWRHF